MIKGEYAFESGLCNVFYQGGVVNYYELPRLGIAGGGGQACGFYTTIDFVARDGRNFIISYAVSFIYQIQEAHSDYGFYGGADARAIRKFMIAVDKLYRYIVS